MGFFDVMKYYLQIEMHNLYVNQSETGPEISLGLKSVFTEQTPAFF